MKINATTSVLSLLAVVTSIVLTGCGDSGLEDPKTFRMAAIEALEEDVLEKRQEGGEEALYHKDTQAPYTGWYMSTDDFGQIRILAHYTDGKKDGGYSQRDELGRMQQQGLYKNGKKDGPWSEWGEDGSERQVNYVEGKQTSP